MARDPVYGFAEKAIAERLKQMALMSPNNRAQGLEIPGAKHQLRCYVVEAKTAISAADGCQVGIPGSGIVYLLQRDLLTNTHPLTYWLTPQGDRQEQGIFNLFEYEIPAGNRFLATQDMSGDLWCMYKPPCQLPSSSSLPSQSSSSQSSESQSSQSSESPSSSSASSESPSSSVSSQSSPSGSSPSGSSSSGASSAESSSSSCNSAYPSGYNVTIPLMSNNLCSDCGDLADTYDVAFDTLTVEGAQYTASIPSAACGYADIIITLNFATCEMRLSIVGAAVPYWEKVVSSFLASNTLPRVVDSDDCYWPMTLTPVPY